jgi:4-methyl-5(b-hydroxyethyl)-thiazole monophosphate biosynthesis
VHVNVFFNGGTLGSTHLRKSNALTELVVKQSADNKPIGAICAAPSVVLANLGLLEGKKATCYPAPKFRVTLPIESNDNVVQDGHIITSQGPATAMEFSLKLIDELFGSQKAAEIARELLYK